MRPSSMMASLEKHSPGFELFSSVKWTTTVKPVLPYCTGPFAAHNRDRL